MNNPLISIITPSYNQHKYIVDTINSVKHQDYRPIEHIIVDGNSNDGTQEALRNYQNENNGIIVKIISENDNGQGDAINKGINIAKGDIISWINSDDVYFHSDTITKVMNYIEMHPKYDIYHGDVAKIEEDGKISFFWVIPQFRINRMSVDGKISQPTVFFKRHVLEKNKLKTDIVPLDFEFWIRLGKDNYTYQHINQLIAGDRRQPNRLSITKNSILKKQHQDIIITNYSTQGRMIQYYYKIISIPTRIIYRIIGIKYIFTLLNKKKYKTQFAFDGYVDNYLILFLRQLLMRIK